MRQIQKGALMISRAIAFIAIAALASMLPPHALAQYNVLHGHIACGAGVISSANHGAYFTAGQPIIGVVTGPSNIVKGGFLYCAGITSTVDVAFVSLMAQLEEDIVILAWKTSESTPVEGYNVYRSEKLESEFMRLTEKPIAAQRSGEYHDEKTLAGKTYFYKIGAISDNREWFSPVLAVSLPAKPTTLYQNYPNPFNPATQIAFYLESDSKVNLSIFDARGARLRTLVEGFIEAGRHVFSWDGSNADGVRVNSGIYYYRLEAGKTIQTKKLVLIR